MIFPTCIVLNVLVWRWRKPHLLGQGTSTGYDGVASFKGRRKEPTQCDTFLPEEGRPERGRKRAPFAPRRAHLNLVTACRWNCWPLHLLRRRHAKRKSSHHTGKHLTQRPSAHLTRGWNGNPRPPLSATWYQIRDQNIFRTLCRKQIIISLLSVSRETRQPTYIRQQYACTVSLRRGRTPPFLPYVHNLSSHHKSTRLTQFDRRSAWLHFPLRERSERLGGIGPWPPFLLLPKLHTKTHTHAHKEQNIRLSDFPAGYVICTYVGYSAHGGCIEILNTDKTKKAHTRDQCYIRTKRYASANTCFLALRRNTYSVPGASFFFLRALDPSELDSVTQSPSSPRPPPEPLLGAISLPTSSPSLTSCCCRCSSVVGVVFICTSSTETPGPRSQHRVMAWSVASRSRNVAIETRRAQHSIMFTESFRVHATVSGGKR